MSDMRPEQPPVTPSTPDHPVRYPMNSVIGVVDTAEQLDGLVSALLAGGFMQSELEVATGSATADAVHASTGRTGLAWLAIRIADKLGAQDEEMEFKQHYEQAMRDSRFIVMVKAPSEERKLRATELLRAHGAHAVSFHGRFTIEGLMPPRDR
jgi:hypothetical protein